MVPFCTVLAYNLFVFEEIFSYTNEDLHKGHKDGTINTH